MEKIINMKIAIVDVAAEYGGALSVLNDLIDYIETEECDNKWYIYTSKSLVSRKDNVFIIQCPKVKKSWLNRFLWETFDSIKSFKQNGIDVILSLQNTGFVRTKIPQVVYFHNVLLLENKKKYSFLSPVERQCALYTRVIAPYTFFSYRKVQDIIVQTNAVKRKLSSKVPNKRIHVIRPNLSLPKLDGDCYCNSIKGIIYPTSANLFKQIEELIQCVSLNIAWFNENDIDILITVSGTENDYAKKIAKMAEGIKRIKLIGYQSREAIIKYYRNYALLNNSEKESYPIPFLEAIFVGSPIVSANYDYAEDILSSYTNKVLFEAHNITSMFDAIRRTVTSNKVVGPNNFIVDDNTWDRVLQLVYCANSKTTD